MVIKIYEGRFGYESFLYEASNVNCNICPCKGDFIFYKDETYKVMYIMLDYDNLEYLVFVRKTTEEDF